MNTMTLAASSAPHELHQQARLLHEAFWRSVRHAVRPANGAVQKRGLKSGVRLPKRVEPCANAARG